MLFMQLKMFANKPGAPSGGGDEVAPSASNPVIKVPFLSLLAPFEVNLINISFQFFLFSSCVCVVMSLFLFSYSW